MNEKLVLTLGVTGQLGKLVADRLQMENSVKQRVTSRRESELSKLADKYGSAVFLDLDDPRTFAGAMHDVDSIFMLTGYSVDMLVQSKALVDAARNAGVKHIVHLGVFSEDHDCYDTHFAWHQLVEAYIQQSGIAYTFLHPNCFMQNFTGFYGLIQSGNVTFYAQGKGLGWIALEDVAEATNVVLIEGEKHFGKDYWFSTEVASIHEVVAIFSEVTGRRITAVEKSPDSFTSDFKAQKNVDYLDPYFVGIAQFFTMFVDGRMEYIGTVRDDMPVLTGRKGMTLRQWAELHKDEIIARC